MKNSLFLLFGLLLAACSADDDNQPKFVTNVVMPAAGTVFKPGDKVTITADGFQLDDEIMFDMRWPLPDGVIKEGYAKGLYAIVTEQSATSITFLAPGHHPASTTEVLLRRAGEMMSLGKIKVADGQAPKEFQLYGIINSRSNTSHTNAAIEHIDMASLSHTVTPIAQLADGEDFYCAVNSPGSWSLSGIRTRGGNRTVDHYDLSMNYWVEEETRTQVVTAGQMPGGGIIYVYENGDHLFLGADNVMPYSRMAMSPSAPKSYLLPEGLAAEALSHYPCVQVDGGLLLLSADHGDGTFSPVVLDLSSGNDQIYVGEPIEAKALIPFWIVKPNADGKTGTRVGGYGVSETDGTTFCLWNMATMTLKEPFATVPNAARSVATLASEDMKKLELYVLLEPGRGDSNGRLIDVYDFLKDEWRLLSGGFPYSEIVVGR